MRSFMNRITHILLVFSVIIISLSATSCSSKKALVKVNTHDITTEQLIDEIDNNAFEFDNLQVKIGAKIKTKGNKFTIKGHLRMKQDSIVWLSISTTVGAELFRIKITADSVYFINKNDKTYFTDGIHVLDRISPMISSIGFIQSIFVGNDINLNKEEKLNLKIEKHQYKLWAENELVHFNNNGQENWTLINKELAIDAGLFRITKYNLEENIGNKKKIELTYDEFEQVDDKTLPTKIKISFSGGSNIEIKLDYSNITTNDNVKYNFKIPKNYKQIDLDD